MLIALHCLHRCRRRHLLYRLCGSWRNHDGQVMGNQHMKDFDKAFGKQKRRTLRDFQRATGLTLPSDNQI